LTSLFIQYDHDPEPFALTGAAETTAVLLIRPLTIYYTNGSSDTIPTGTVAVLADGVTHTFDRSLAVWVIWTVPGSGLLYATLESQLAGITGDYAPILRVLRHDTRPYRPMQPSGTALKAGAWSGGAFIGAGRAISGGGSYGIFNSQSIQGGGSVSGVPAVFSTFDNANNRYMRFGCFFKVASLPASDMTLIDLNAGVTGYLRMKLTSAGRVIVEGSYKGTNSLTLNPTTAVTTGTFFYAAGVMTTVQGINGFWRLRGQVWATGGATDGTKVADTGGLTFSQLDDTTAALGWGVSKSSSYLDFPNSTGNELSKLMGDHGGYAYYNSDAGTFSPPSSDPSASGYDYLYLCRQTVGSVSSLTDSTTNHFDLTPGASGMTIVVDGPYT
jgi:hypothetical protein